MGRSSKKGPFIEPSLRQKVEAMNASGDRRVIRTWSRDSTIFPTMVGSRSPRMMADAMCQCLSLRTWSAISWASSLRPGPSEVTEDADRRSGRR